MLHLATKYRQLLRYQKADLAEPSRATSPATPALYLVGLAPTSLAVLQSQFTVVVEQRLQVLVAVQGGTSQPHVVRTQSAHVPGTHHNSSGSKRPVYDRD